jgi:hypothetical protein
VVTDDGTRLRIADDEAGERLWPTEAKARGPRSATALVQQTSNLVETGDWDGDGVRDVLVCRGYRSVAGPRPRPPVVMRTR